jgi:hypothetical protein
MSSHPSSSVSTVEKDSFINSPPEIRRFASPPPGDITPSGKSYYSPPPAPRCFSKSAGASEPNADSVLNEINTGRSMFNPARMDITSISLSRRLLYKEFESEAEGDDFTTHISQSYPQWPPPSSPDGVGETVDLDMPSMPSPIKLSMRTGARAAPTRGQFTPTLMLLSRSDRFHEHDFIPIRFDDDDEESQNEGLTTFD